MSADLLRRAAEALREAAINATPGPWYEDTDGFTFEVRDVEPPPLGFAVVYDRPTVTVGVSEQQADARHIALMHPGVALALADWLDIWADVLPEYPCECGLVDDDPHCEHSAPLALARAIIGEQP